MINIRYLGIKNYKFADGERIITTLNPTQATYEYIRNSRPSDPDWINEVFASILSESDNDMNDIPVEVKVIVLTDYIRFHTEQLGGRFPSSSDPE